MYYKLDKNKNVVPCSFEEWGHQHEEMERNKIKHIGDEIVDDKRISTVFLGLCFNKEIPRVFETIVFDENGKGIYQDKYSTWKEAEEGHEIAIQWVKDRYKNE